MPREQSQLTDGDAHSSNDLNKMVSKSTSNKLWTRQFVVGTLINFVIALNYFMLMVIMTAYALEKYDASATAAAFCASIFIIGTLFARFICAPLMTHFGKKTLMVAGGTMVIIFTGFYLLEMPFVLLFAIRFVHGMAYGVCSTTIATIVTGIVPASRKGEGIGYFMLSVPLGSALGPFLGVSVSRNMGYETLFVIAFVLALLMIPCLFGLGKIPEAPKSKAAFPNKASKSKRSFNQMLYPFIENSVLPIAFICGIIFFGYSSLLTFLTPYSIEIGLSRAASVFFVIYALAMFVTRPFTGKAFDRKGPTVVMTPAFFSFSIGMIILAFAANDWMILVSAAFLGFAVGTVQSSGLSMAVRIASDERLSVANATFYMLLDCGVGVGPIILGVIVPLIGYSNLYMLMAAVGMIAFALFLAILRKRA